MPSNQYRIVQDTINNTNDLNPMIMMSGEEGSASASVSQINLTSITQGNYPHQQQTYHRHPNVPSIISP